MSKKIALALMALVFTVVTNVGFAGPGGKGSTKPEPIQPRLVPPGIWTEEEGNVVPVTVLVFNSYGIPDLMISPTTYEETFHSDVYTEQVGEWDYVQTMTVDFSADPLTAGRNVEWLCVVTDETNDAGEATATTVVE